MSIFEAIMLLCFGSAWPFSVYKTYTSKTTNGKSLIFLLVLIAGYISGISHKLFFSYDPIIYLYVLNLSMISADVFIYVRNLKQRQEERKLVLVKHPIKIL